jgi:ectoine hydroxylase-related dioxygenase (phytanoyl-CoA dioxygenase family)
MTLELLNPTAASVEAIVDHLQRDGFAIVERYLDDEQVAAKRADLERVLAAVPTGRNDFEGTQTRRIYALYAKTRAFDREAIDPLVLGVLDRVLGPAQLSAPVGISIGPGETAQPLHRDEAVYPLSPPKPELVVNTMWALDDFTEENGATRVAVGSHRWAQQPPDDEVETVAAVMPAGSVMFFLGSLVHGGGANRTDRSRLGVILHYCAAWLRPQENHVLGVPKDVVRGLPERLQELLGYGVYGPFLGNVDGRHPRKYLSD